MILLDDDDEDDDGVGYGRAGYGDCAQGSHRAGQGEAG